MSKGSFWFIKTSDLVVLMGIAFVCGLIAGWTLFSGVLQ